MNKVILTLAAVASTAFAAESSIEVEVPQISPSDLGIEATSVRGRNLGSAYFCGKEGGQCKCNGYVYYGAIGEGFNIKWSYGSIQCSNHQFGNPANKAKSCYCFSQTRTCPMPSCQPPKGAKLRKVGWPYFAKCPSCAYVYGAEDIISLVYSKVADRGSFCSGVGGTCDCDGDVYFGSPGGYYWRRRTNVKGPLFCGSQNFGGHGTECRCRRRNNVCAMAGCSRGITCPKGESRLAKWGNNGCPVPCATICGKAVPAPKGKRVAEKNGRFRCHGTAYYGRKASFVSKKTDGVVTCDEKTFSDPLWGQDKYCTCDGRTSITSSTGDKIWNTIRRF